MKKYLMEGIGTFFFTLTVLLGLSNGAGFTAPLAAGAMLAALGYAGSGISGAHFNPALSLSMLIGGKLERFDFPYYVLAQLLGSSLAALMGSFLLRCGQNPELIPRVNDFSCALIAEFLGTFVLGFTFLLAQSSQNPGARSNGNVLMGLVFFAGMVVFSPISGGYFNPALVIGLCIAGMIAWSDVLLYFLGGILGAAAAVSLFRVVSDQSE